MGRECERKESKPRQRRGSSWREWKDRPSEAHRPTPAISEARDKSGDGPRIKGGPTRGGKRGKPIENMEDTNPSGGSGEGGSRDKRQPAQQ
jgi:hypothetical protein